MNRQARQWDTDPWEDFGVVTHAEAAKQLAIYENLHGLHRVMTRDEDSPDVWFFHDVRTQTTYTVKSLRCDDQAMLAAFFSGRTHGRSAEGNEDENTSTE